MALDAAGRRGRRRSSLAIAPSVGREAIDGERGRLLCEKLNEANAEVGPASATGRRGRLAHCSRRELRRTPGEVWGDRRGHGGRAGGKCGSHVYCKVTGRTLVSFDVVSVGCFSALTVLDRGRRRAAVWTRIWGLAGTGRATRRRGGQSWRGRAGRGRGSGRGPFGGVGESRRGSRWWGGRRRRRKSCRGVVGDSNPRPASNDPRHLRLAMQGRRGQQAAGPYVERAAWCMMGEWHDICLDNP